MRSHGVVRGGIIVPVSIPPVVDVLVVPVVEDVLVAALGLLNHANCESCLHKLVGVSASETHLIGRRYAPHWSEGCRGAGTEPQ